MYLLYEEIKHFFIHYMIETMKPLLKIFPIYLYTMSHHIVRSSNGNIFHVIGPLWGESTNGFPSQRASNAKRLCFILSAPEQMVEQWFEMPLCSLWRHCNEMWKWFCFPLFHHGYIRAIGTFMQIIYPYPAGLLRWHYMITTLPIKKP